MNTSKVDLLDICGGIGCASALAWTLGVALEGGRAAAETYAEAARGISILLDYIEKDVVAIGDALHQQPTQDAP